MDATTVANARGLAMSRPSRSVGLSQFSNQEAGRVSDELSAVLAGWLASLLPPTLLLLVVLSLAVRFIPAAGTVAIVANRCAQTLPCLGVGSER